MSKNIVLPLFKGQKKEIRKVVRSVIQVILLLSLVVIVVKEIFLFKKYEEFNYHSNVDNGFIALSYFGIDRTGSPKYISQENLEKQLTNLHNQGFVTISQQDIINYYENGKNLPEKSLYLLFEDGRTDSAIFSQNTLEKLNYKATMFTYSNKMSVNDRKFLQPKDLSKLESSGYWEIGSNGHRLTYINVFNSKGNSLGIIDENELPDKTKIEYYNHYLMDFVRDEFMIPLENRIEMEKRISREYSLMKEIYQFTLGYTPKSYAIMHANSLYHDMNRLVENKNDTEIRDTFQMHFNLEGNAYNGKETDQYNLSRMQVSPYWSMNHLLMKLQNDTQQPIEFEIGEQEKANDWDLDRGAVEFSGNQIILTSPPSEEGLIVLKKELPRNYNLRVTLKGNVIGEQNIYMHYDKTNHTYLKLSLQNNNLLLMEKLKNQEERQLAVYSLDDVTWDGEDYALNKATIYSYADTQTASQKNGSDYPRTVPGSRQLNITMEKNQLHILVDNSIINKTVDFDSTHISNKIALGSLYVEKEPSYEQYADGIYDAVFEDMIITSDNFTIYNNAYNHAERILNNTVRTFNKIVDFFIKTF